MQSLQLFMNLEMNGQCHFHAIAVLTAVITAFYTTRMMGLVFFGKKSKHIEKMEEEGHHIHEAPLSMWIPYGILAVLTIGIGLIGLSFRRRTSPYVCRLS